MEYPSPSMKFLGRMSQERYKSGVILLPTQKAIMRAPLWSYDAHSVKIEKSTSKPYLGWIDINILRQKIRPLYSKFVSFLPQNELIYRKPSVYVSCHRCKM